MSLKLTLKKYFFPIILLISIFLGMVTGWIFGNNVTVIKPLGEVFINMLFTIVVPLVFFTISSSIANMSSLKRLGKILVHMLIIFGITSFIASVFMLLGVFIINPVGDLNLSLVDGVKETVDIGTSVVEMFTVTDFNQLLSKSHMFPLIIFSIFFGVCVSLTGEEANPLKKILDVCSKVMMKFINLIMYYAPIGLFAYFACLVGDYGPALIGEYAKTLIFYLVMSILYYVIFYSFYIYLVKGRNGVKSSFKKMFVPTVTALGTCSSLATLPTNLEAAEELKVSKDVRELVLPIGATMHMEGSSMASILKIVFLFTIFGESFSGAGTILIALLISVLSGVVMSGIPGGGLIGEMLIVSLYNFPLSAFPLIATIGWLIDSPATALNAVGDIPATMMIDKIVKEKLEVDKN